MTGSKTNLLDNTMAFLSRLWELTRKDAFTQSLGSIDTFQELLLSLFDLLEPILSFIFHFLLFEPLKYAGFVHGSNLSVIRSNCLNLLTISGLTKRHAVSCIFTSFADIAYTLLWSKA